MMFERVGAVAVAGLVSLCVSLVGARASAQSVVTSTGACAPVVSDSTCTIGGACLGSDPPSTCVRLSTGGPRTCVPDGALLCCSDYRDCPGPTGTGGGTCRTDILSGGGVCLPPGASYCSSPDSIGVREIRRCHSFGALSLLPYGQGDCDQDGIPNATEFANGTDPCLASPPMGTWSEAGCVQLAVDCRTEAPDCNTSLDETGDCVTTMDSSGSATGSLCVPVEPALYCLAHASWVCPSDTAAVRDPARSITWCIPPGCGEPPPVSCVIKDGDPVPWAEGDCDGDGTPNGEEIAEGTELCPATLPDAGIPGGDAGTIGGDAGFAADAGPRGDAGPRPDAGSSPDGGAMNADASPDIPVAFGGGGGCVCRAAPSRGGSLAWLLVFGAGALALLRRRG